MHKLKRVERLPPKDLVAGQLVHATAVENTPVISHRGSKNNKRHNILFNYAGFSILKRKIATQLMRK